MPDYRHGKVYAIRSPHLSKFYVGSTTLTLAQRMAEHRRLHRYYSIGKGAGMCRGCTSATVISAGDAYIELIEECPCDSKDQLNARETHYQRIYAATIVNQFLASRPPELAKEEMKELRLAQARVYDARRRAKKRGEELPPLPAKLPLVPDILQQDESH